MYIHPLILCREAGLPLRKLVISCDQVGIRHADSRDYQVYLSRVPRPQAKKVCAAQKT